MKEPIRLVMHRLEAIRQEIATIAEVDFTGEDRTELLAVEQQLNAFLEKRPESAQRF